MSLQMLWYVQWEKLNNQPTKQLTNSIKHSPPWKATSASYSQEINHI